MGDPLRGPERDARPGRGGLRRAAASRPSAVKTERRLHRDQDRADRPRRCPTPTPVADRQPGRQRLAGRERLAGRASRVAARRRGRHPVAPAAAGVAAAPVADAPSPSPTPDPERRRRRRPARPRRPDRRRRLGAADRQHRAPDRGQARRDRHGARRRSSARSPSRRSLTTIGAGRQLRPDQPGAAS